MNLTEKLSSLLKEKEEQERIEKKAHQRIIEINKTVKAVERLIKEAEEILGAEVICMAIGLPDEDVNKMIDNLANSTDNHLSL